MSTKHPFVVLFCLFVAMIGFGITMPVLPFYVERLALAEGATRQETVIHVGLLTGVDALGQLIFAPLWGHWSDRIGRRPLILIDQCRRKWTTCLTSKLAARPFFSAANLKYILQINVGYSSHLPHDG
ncbi:MAG: MFS transporter [Geobacteraceae bacterium]